MTPRVKINTGIFVVLFVVFGLFFIGNSGLYMLSGLRAYVNAEALWSKGQKEAVYQLIQYVFTEKEAKYHAFIDNLQVPLGDTRARLELQKNNPVGAIAFDGFADGGNDPEDIPKMIFLFKYFHGWGYIKEAIKQWEIADLHIVKLLEVGEKTHELIVNKRMNLEQSSRILSRIDILQKGVTSAEVLFSKNISEATRWFSKLFLTIMLIFTVVGSIVCFVVMRLIAGVSKDLLASEERYRRLTENAPDMIYRMSLPGGEYDYVSPAAEQIFGYTQQEFYTTPALIKDVIHPDWLNYFQKQWSRLLSGEMPPFYEYQIVEKSGEIRWVHQRNVLLKADSGKPIAIEGIVTDITERKKSEEEKLQLESQLRQAHKMEAIGTLAGGIAHDFNNILAVILGYAEMAMEDIPYDSPAKEQIVEILKAGNRAKELVQHILSFSRKESHGQIPLKVHDILKEALKFLRATVPTTIEIKEDLDHSCGNILGDATQIHQVIVNLCTNAAQAMEEHGGCLEVSSSCLELSERDLINEPGMTAGLYLMLKFKDSGPGITPQNINRIFDPYFTTKEVGKGSGMGLAVVTGIVKSHSGMITVDSPPGGGTTFKVYLPRIEDKIENRIAEKSPLPTGKENILIVDDDASIANLTQKRLEAINYGATAMTSSVKALEHFRNTPDAYDLVITDQTMPEMTGVKLATELLSIRADIPIIMCTGYSSKIDAEKASSIGIKAFIMKPVENEKLARAVRQVLDTQ